MKVPLLFQDERLAKLEVKTMMIINWSEMAYDLSTSWLGNLFYKINGLNNVDALALHC